MRKILSIIIIFFIIISTLALTIQFEDSTINILVVYNQGSNSYLDAYQNFKQSLVANMKVDCSSIQDINVLSSRKYQLIYLDVSLIGSPDFNSHKNAFIKYVKDGGSLFLENEFYDVFPLDFLGASEFKSVESFPKSLELPQLRYNLVGLQSIIRDFHSYYSKFSDMALSENVSFGYGIVPSTAETLVSSQGTALYTLNRWGKGSVFFASLILPNRTYITGFDMKPKNDSQRYFNYSAATANYLLRNEFAAFVSKERYGYSIKKVLGTYGRPAMAWQNHFEVASAVKNSSMQKWIDFLKPYHQIPSFTLARSAYEWGVWKESIAYHINIGTNEAPAFFGEEEGFHYSSGKHAMVDKDYLTIQAYPEYKSLSWPIDMPHRAYPYAADLDGDSITDLISGSSDGHIYFYKGKPETESWNFEKGVQLQYEDGNPMNFGSYSAPLLYDINSDGKNDLVVGNGEGYIYTCIRLNGLSFGKPEVTLEKNLSIKVASPDIGDADGDGTDDLVVGDENGNLHMLKGNMSNSRLLFGKPAAFTDSSNKQINSGRFTAPRLFDVDGDGLKDILVGNNNGFIKKFINKYSYLIDSGYIEGQTLNPYGNSHLWGGRNTVPFISDINKDGKFDLVLGQLEFGMPTPIDAPGFPYKEELKNAIEYARKNFVDIHPHVYVHNYKNSQQEQTELELHRKAFEFYGLQWNNTGTNQHTWRVNNIDPVQTFKSEYSQGILWNSGFRPANNPIEPSLGYEYAWSMPFILSDGEKTQGILLFNPAPNIPNYEQVYPSLAALDIPISYFYHVEYPVLTEDGIKDLSYKSQFLDNFRNQNDYNFMTEDQMSKSILAALKARYKISSSPALKLFNSLQNRLRTKKHFDININPIDLNNGIAGDYANAIGVKFEPGEKYSNVKFNSSSDIYFRKNNNLYLSAGEKTKIYIDYNEDSPHIERVNMPIDIQSKKERASTIIFNGKGLQQIKFYSPKGIEVKSKDWNIEQQGDYYILTRYGDITTLDIAYK